MNRKLLEIILELKDKLTPGLGKAATAGSRQLNKITTSVQKMKAGFAKAVFSVKGLVVALAGLVIFKQVIRWMTESVILAQEQETALTKMNAALMATGNFSEDASAGLQVFATNLQALIGIGDEATFEILSIIEGLTKLSAEALPDAMRATVGIANLVGIDLKGAAIALGKTLTSNVNSLIRYGIEVDLAGDATQRLEQILESTTAGFAIAEAKAKTFEGRMVILSAAWGDFREVVGMYITTSPKINAAITFLTDKIIDLTTATNDARDAGDDLVGVIFVEMIRKSLKLTIALSFVVRILFQARIGMRNLAISMDEATLAQLALNKALGLTNPLLFFLNTITDVDEQIVSTARRLREMNDELGNFQENLDKAVAVEEEAKDLLEAFESAVLNASGQVERGTPIIRRFGEEIDDMAGAANSAAESIFNLTDQQRLFNEVFGQAAPTRAPLVTEEDIAFFEALHGIEVQRFAGVDPFTGRGGELLGDPEVKRILNEMLAEMKAARVTPAERIIEFAQILQATITGPQPETVSETPGFFKAAFKNLQRNDVLLGLLGQGIQGGVAGGGRGALGAILPGIGTAIGGPIGGVVGGLLGGLVGRKKRQRGDTRSNPIFVHDVAKDNIFTELLNVVKAGLVSGGSAGISDLWLSLRKQGQRLGAT